MDAGMEIISKEQEHGEQCLHCSVFFPVPSFVVTRIVRAAVEGTPAFECCVQIDTLQLLYVIRTLHLPYSVELLVDLDFLEICTSKNCEQFSKYPALIIAHLTFFNVIVSCYFAYKGSRFFVVAWPQHNLFKYRDSSQTLYKVMSRSNILI